MAIQQEHITSRIKAHLDHISGEVQQGLYALKHGDEDSLELSLVAIQRVCMTTLQQLHEAQRCMSTPLAPRRMPSGRTKARA